MEMPHFTDGSVRRGQNCEQLTALRRLTPENYLRGYQFGARLRAGGLAPAVAEQAVHGLGIETSHQFPKQPGHQNNAEEQKRYGMQRFTRAQEKAKKRKHHEHVREVHLVAITAES